MARRLQLLFCILFLFCACKREDPNPELLDPIYSDLLKTLNEYKQNIESEKKKLVAAQLDFRRSVPQTLDIKNAARDVARAERNIYFLEQKMHYQTIRVERRKVEDHVAYHEAFIAGKEWPPKEDFEQYQTSRRLATAPKMWSAHIPKLFEKKAPPKVEKKRPGGEPGAE